MNGRHSSILVIIIGIAALTIGLFMGSFFTSPGEKVGDHPANHSDAPAEVTIWTCSMHPQIRQMKSGQCPICAMDLIPLIPEGDGNDKTNQHDIQMSASALALSDIKTVVVSLGTPQGDLQLLGKVQPDERKIADLTARFNGRIEGLYINYAGQRVKKGQPLATVFSPELMTSQKELLEAAKIKDTNPSFYQAARNRLKLLDFRDQQIDAIETAGRPLHRVDIYAPIAGTVISRHVARGEYIREGDTLFEIVNLDTVWILFEAYESDLLWIETGDPVHVTVDAFPDSPFSAPIQFIDPFLDKRTRISAIRVEVSNPDHKLKPGMFARGTVSSIRTNRTEEILIPQSAVLWTGKRSLVYVRLPDRSKTVFQYREVTLGPEAGAYIVIKEGLKEGEEIAVNGVFRIDSSAQLAGKASMMNPMKKDDTGPHGNDQAKKRKPQDMLQQADFRVFGRCQMCKDRIEQTVMKLEGLAQANWDADSQKLHISFDPQKISIPEIHKALALVGHDTDMERAPDEIYSKLPACCHYREEEPEETRLQNP